MPTPGRGPSPGPEVMDARWQRDTRLLVELWYLMKTAGERG